MYDEQEEDRLEHIQIAKSRGKGAPKKKKTVTGEYISVVRTNHPQADSYVETKKRGGKKK